MDLAALANKYAVLARLRARREALEAAGVPGFDDPELAARRHEMVALARVFPGVMRELEACDAVLLRDKGEAVAAARADAVPAWIVAVAEFHALLRDVLAIKLFLARRRPGRVALEAADIEACRAWAAGLASPLGWPVDAASLDALRRPGGGRVLPLVWATLEARLGRPRDWLERAVFGRPDDLAPAAADDPAAAPDRPGRGITP